MNQLPPRPSFSQMLTTYKGHEHVFDGKIRPTPIELARSGFSFCEGKDVDSVKCADCKEVHSGWKPHDDIHDEHKLHFPECPKSIADRVVRTEVIEGNRRLSCASCQERLDSFHGKDHLFSEFLYVNTKTLARNGFYHANQVNTDKVICVACRGVLKGWGTNDIVKVEHARHFPACPIVKGNISGDSNFVTEINFTIRNTCSSEYSGNTTLANPTQLGVLVEVDNCIPEYSSLESRIYSFLGRTRLFSLENATALVLASNGFFSIDENQDRVKCVLCTGILKDFTKNDIVSKEHLKNFPACLIAQEKISGRSDFVRKTPQASHAL
ncbi:MAG: hypothetical protein KAG53_09180 [Endozoicomonadaceae bacterium]|nr:hypothetical protein [Endozoicomonadaceae bacterium]